MTQSDAKYFGAQGVSAGRPWRPVVSVIWQSTHVSWRRRAIAGSAGLIALGLTTACSSTSTTVAQGNNADAGTHTGGKGNGGAGNTSLGGAKSVGGSTNGGGASSTGANCLLKLGVTGCLAPPACCETGLACVSDKCVIDTPLANGAACTGPAECAAKTCLASTCGPPPCRNSPDTCNNDFPCCSGQYCSGAGSCQPMGKLSDGCSATQPCGAGLQCNTTSHLCEACPPCVTGGSPCCGGCGIGNLCNLLLLQFFCLASRQDGATCTSPADCCNGNCVNQICTKTCAALGGLCSISADCCSGECLANQCVYSSCSAAGVSCNTDSNCCSNHCGTNAKCQ
jgi:hypothetical protein